MAEPNITEAERLIRYAKRPGEVGLPLEWLDLTELPESVSEFTNLHSLFLSHNRLTELPGWLSRLQTLIALYVADNWLAHLPGPFERLHTLDASHNRLRGITSNITGCTSLRARFLGHNYLKEVPDSIAQLDRLEVLNLAGNELTELPDAMGRLSELNVLNLASNRLTDLPDSLGRLPKLNALQLSGNPLTGELAEVAKRGTEAVLEFLRARANAQTRQWRAKLMLVGEGMVGKTNLLRRLKGESFIANNEPTHNLEIRQLEIPHPSEAGVTIGLRAWDFGGQFFMHATHQFFYSGKSVFLKPDSKA